MPYVVGGRILWETPLDGLRVGGSVEAVRLDTTAFVPGIDPIKIENHSLLWVGSAEYSTGDLLLTAEYSRWSGKQSSNAPALSPPVDNTSERGYLMASYRVAPWLQPGAYYSVLFPDIHHREGRENRQYDVARFDINTPGTLRRWPDERVIQPVDLAPTSPARSSFSQEVLGRSVAAVRAYWQQRIFSGRDVPPPELTSDDRVVEFVLKHEEALAYVSGTTPLAGAKAVSVTR